MWSWDKGIYYGIFCFLKLFVWQPTPVFLPGESHGRRSLVGYSPQGPKESDRTERLHFTFTFSISACLVVCYYIGSCT